MAHKKGQGSSRNGRDSSAQYRGIKVFDGELVRPGGIIVRQVGSLYHPGRNVGEGKDFTLYALVEGHVKFERYGRDRKRVRVIPRGAPVAAAPAARA